MVGNRPGEQGNTRNKILLALTRGKAQPVFKRDWNQTALSRGARGRRRPRLADGVVASVPGANAAFHAVGRGRY